MPIGMTFRHEDIITIILAVVGFAIVIWAQIKVKGAFSKYKQVKVNKNINGVETARLILEKNGLSNVYVVETKGILADHYDPKRKVIKLSPDVFHGESIAAVSVAAHEVAHAIQDKEDYTFMRIRAMLVPIVNFVSYAGYFVILISIILGALDYLFFGALMIIVVIVFQLITLPVEINASRRAMTELLKINIVNEQELVGCKKMLDAAAMTYVASIISSLISLLRILIMMNNRRR